MARPITDKLPVPAPLEAEAAPTVAGEPAPRPPAGAAARAGKWLRDVLLGPQVNYDRRAVWAGLALVVLWAFELHAVQGHTLISPNELGWRGLYLAPPVRFVLDLLFFGVLVLWLPRRVLPPVLVLSTACYLVLMTYFHYFRKPLSLLTIVNNWREGSSVGQLGIELFPTLAATLLGLALAAKCALWWWGRSRPLPPRPALRLGGLALLGYVALFGITLWLDPLEYIQTRRGVGRLGVIRGYLGPWAAEWYYLNNEQILDTALRRRSDPSDKLTPLENPIPIRRRLIVLQAESLDYNVLGHRVAGQDVTPFLNALRERSMFFRVRAVHAVGSSDADFVSLFNVKPSPHQNTYKIPGYPIENTLPQFLAPWGFKTWAFHGQTGEFYSRRGAWERMQFAELNFREELVDRYGLAADSWGVRDTDVLRVSQQLLKTTPGRVCHFIITLTTHTPYTMLKPAEKRLFPAPTTLAQNYFNNMNYLDRTLQEYLTPLRDATVLIYADHSTEVTDRDFRPDREGAREWIPCFIYDSETDLAALQKTRGRPVAQSGELNLLDVTTYLRHQISRQFAADAPPPAAPAGAADDR